METKTVLTGKVKFFNEKKGYGFIIDDESLNEFFFHISKTLEPVKTDDQVEYIITDS